LSLILSALIAVASRLQWQPELVSTLCDLKHGARVVTLGYGFVTGFQRLTRRVLQTVEQVGVPVPSLGAKPQPVERDASATALIVNGGDEMLCRGEALAKVNQKHLDGERARITLGPVGPVLGDALGDAV
jgi:hypothetical protein